MREIVVKLPSSQCTILIAHGLLANLPSLVRDFLKDRKVAIIVDANLPGLVKETIKALIREWAPMVLVLALKGGEDTKDMDTILKLATELTKAQFDRSDRIVAVGGGSISDVAGLLAALYMRGLRYLSIPTTTLSQCDACLGGKVGVNFAGAKNLLGTFYHPSLVLVDSALAQTLDPIHRKTGLVEAIKAGIIGDSGLFSMMEGSLEQIVSCKREDLVDHVIYRALRVKADIVMQDERESGPRMKLNLGHTIGHAIEMLTGPDSIPHGEAVAVGIMTAATIALDRRILPLASYKRIINLTRQLIFSGNWKNIEGDQIVQHTALDKKRRQGRLYFVLPTDIGSVVIVKDIKDEEITQSLETVCTYGQ